MRFLRRGARGDERPIEQDDAEFDDAAALEADGVAPDDEPAADIALSEPDADPDAELAPDPEPADAEPPAEPTAGRDAEDESSSVEIEPADADDEAGPEPLAALATDSGESVDAEQADAEGLSGLVAGGARAAHRPAPAAVDLGPDPLADGRAAPLRLAGLHLRTGQHALARAQLEAIARRGRLDDEAMLDLAEVRWRTGDLAGAGETANALIARGSEAPLALVIAAEAVAAAGRPTEARRLSARAVEVNDRPLEPLFAGMPRASIWPAATSAEAAVDAPRRKSRRPRAEGDGAPTTASEAFAGGRAALARGDANRAGLLLGVAMRLEPGFAEDVLRAVQGRDDQPLLALVHGDALRLLGREAEALEAFDRARGRSAAAAARPEEALGPGLFDDDPG